MVQPFPMDAAGQSHVPFGTPFVFHHPDTMLDAIRRLIGDNVQGTPGAHSRTHPHDVRVAACVLLLELANVDGEFSDLERQRILEILQRHFGVDEAGAVALMTEAASASRDAADDFVFTRQVVREYTLAQRMVLAELMWQVVLADGAIDGQESYLMRKLANLLQLEPAYLAEARKRTEGEAK
ncbi:MAG: TerB family tellurite resistance protein [Gemmatimonadaceae bacterium]|nr:TerB family tellurite resistance protein [Gemmatimonadaceae bacterium]